LLFMLGLRVALKCFMGQFFERCFQSKKSGSDGAVF